MPAKEHYQFPENHIMDPFHICGGLYYIGDDDVCAYLLDTGDGLILIDTNWPTAQALLIHSIWSLGFDPRNVKMILHSHGHFDHFGCTNFIKAISGAKTYLGWKDAKMFREQPELALCDDSEPYASAQLFTPDHELHDGDVVRLGNVEIACVETPGHTEGTMSYFFNLTEDGKSYRVGLFGGVGRNTMRKSFYEQYNVSGYREMFAGSIARMRQETVDIALGTHTVQASFLKNREALLTGAEKNPFIAPDQWTAFLDHMEWKLNQLLEDPDEQV